METFDVVASDGAVSRVTRAGDAGPALVFVHGVGSNASSFAAQLAAFQPAYRCYAIDLRGNGIAKPEPDPASITREGFTRDVLALLDRESIDRCTIVGNSLGGVVAFELWKTAPDRVRAMVLVGSFARYPDARAYVDRIVAGVRASDGMASFARGRASALGLSGEKAETLVEQMGAKTIDSYIASTRATWTGDYLDTLPGIRVPALVVWGSLDSIAPRALSEEIVRGIPGAQLTVFEGAGHITHDDAPEAFNHTLREFLERSDR